MHEQRRNDPKRHVKPEDDRPMQVLGNGAAKGRPGEAGHDPRRAHVGLVAAPLARRDHIGDSRLGQRHDPAAPDSLQCTASDQYRHVGRRRGYDRTCKEQADRQQHHDASAVDVGELAVERRHHRRRQQIGNDDPRQVLEITELTSDGRQRGDDDGLIERRQEHAHHQAVKNAAYLGLGQRRVPHRLGCGRLDRLSARGGHSNRK